MDIFSHGLYGGIALGRKKLSNYIFAFLFSILPDILSEGLIFALIFMGASDMPSYENGHPNILEFPLYAQNFYNATHSLIVFSAVFILVWIIIKRAYLPLLAWAIHIVIDIPTHSIDLFPTPFLWPVSDFKIDGIPWREPEIWLTYTAISVILYLIWYFKRKQKKQHNTN